MVNVLLLITDSQDDLQIRLSLNLVMLQTAGKEHSTTNNLRNGLKTANEQQCR